MAHGVFLHRSDSIYADIPAERYQFPARYYKIALECIGDWIVYLEPRRAREARGYFAVAKIENIIHDQNNESMFIALIEKNTYLELPNPVPFKSEDGYAEKGLLNNDGKPSGNKQSAVRLLSPEDFAHIIDRGLKEENLVLPRDNNYEQPPGFAEDQAAFILEQPRNRTYQLNSRIVRDSAFRRIILRAYGERCAITGLKLINGGGRAEVNAAHIRPVEKNGPDTVNNGIALSGTAHWMFDRGLISLSNELEILISRQANDPDSIRSFINPNGIAFSPQRSNDRPHPQFLEWHRNYCFKK